VLRILLKDGELFDTIDQYDSIKYPFSIFTFL